MVSYSNFNLTTEQINSLKTDNARRAIERYIKQNGHEPTNISQFYTATPEEIERRRRSVYSYYLTKGIEPTNNGGDSQNTNTGTTTGTTDNIQINPTTSNYYENIPFDVNDIPNNQIWYQTYSNSMLIPFGISTAGGTSQGLFGANLLSNKYNNNFGILTFDGDVTNMATWTFFEQEDLMALAVPKCQKEVGGLNRSGLKYLLFPTNSNLEIIGDLSFCPLEQITIPKYVTTIHNLYGCTKLSTIISHPLTAPTIVGNESFKYAGRDVSGEKFLYVRQNAVGYDDGKWVTQVQNNGYVKTVF